MNLAAGTGEVSLRPKSSILGHNYCDDSSVEILIVEDNTYSAYALMSILEQY